MKPPEATQADRQGQAGATPPAVSLCPLETLQNRADFLKANHGRRQGTPGFLLQARKRLEDEAASNLVRVGFTCSKKVGNAVARNRAKRRLREIARMVLPLEGQPGWDYVLIGRRDVTATRPFETLKQDLSGALGKIHGKQPCLPPDRQPMGGQFLPFPTNLFRLRNGSIGKAWRYQWQLAGGKKDRSVPSLGQGRL